MFRSLLPPHRWRDDPAVHRSGSWANVRRRFLAQHPVCAACGSRSRLTAHHIIPVQLAPELELDPNNLIALCASLSYGVHCHLFFGHLGRWQQHNPNVRADAAGWRRLHTMRLIHQAPIT